MLNDYKFINSFKSKGIFKKCFYLKDNFNSFLSALATSFHFNKIIKNKKAKFMSSGSQKMFDGSIINIINGGILI